MELLLTILDIVYSYIVPSSFCYCLNFCQLYAPPVVRTSIHLKADAGPNFRDNIHLIGLFLSGIESGLSSGYPWDNNASPEQVQGISCVIASIVISLILTH